MGGLLNSVTKQMKPLKALTTFGARLGHQSKKNGTGKLNNNVGLEVKLPLTII